MSVPSDAASPRAWEATMRLEGEALEGRNGVLWEVLPMFEYILDCFYELVLGIKMTINSTAWDSKLTIITRKQTNLLPISPPLFSIPSINGNTLSRRGRIMKIGSQPASRP
jgi:hypothetical protein